MAERKRTRSALEIQEKLQETLLDLSTTSDRKLFWLQLRERARALEWALGRTSISAPLEMTGDGAADSLQDLSKWWTDTAAPRSVTLEIKDVRTDGFPEERTDGWGSCYFWPSDGSGLINGWPLIAEPGEYDSNGFRTPKQAKEEPSEVQWEARARGDGYFDVEFWVSADELQKAFKP